MSYLKTTSDNWRRGSRVTLEFPEAASATPNSVLKQDCLRACRPDPDTHEVRFSLASIQNLGFLAPPQVNLIGLQMQTQLELSRILSECNSTPEINHDLSLEGHMTCRSFWPTALQSTDGHESSTHLNASNAWKLLLPRDWSWPRDFRIEPRPFRPHAACRLDTRSPGEMKMSGGLDTR